MALSEQMRKSQLMASSQPPPRANPFTAAMTGIGNTSSARKISFPFLPKASPSSFVSVLICAISAPATKLFSPAPVMIRQRTASWSTPSSTAFRSSRTSAFSAFSAFGRLMVMMPICPSAA